MNLPFRESLQPWQKGSRGQWLLLIVKNALASFPLSRCYPYFLTIKLIASGRSISSIFSPRNAALLKPPALRYCQTFEVKWTPLYVKQCLWWGPNFGTCSQPNWNQSPEMVPKRSKFCPSVPKFLVYPSDIAEKRMITADTHWCDLCGQLDSGHWTRLSTL